MNATPDSSQPSEPSQPKPPASRLRKWLLFASGFFGWFLVTGLFYRAMYPSDAQTICSGLLFPVHIGLLVLLLEKQPHVGWGMLSALGANFVISLMLGLSNNAICFVPFFNLMPPVL
jgi:hypothetical protein